MENNIDITELLTEYVDLLEKAVFLKRQPKAR